MNIQIPKKVAVISDIAGYGRCALTASLPVISSMGVQACPVPTSVFSNNTAFPTCHYTDYTEHLAGYFSAWEALSLRFDGILCGFFSDIRQMETVENFLEKQAASAIIVIDPVMGDHGSLYRTLKEAHCTKMKSLIQKADIITPNLTEACLLTDTAYRENNWNTEALTALCEKLHELGPDSVVITGIPDENSYVNFIYENGSCTSYKAEAAGGSYFGTGDIFSSIIVSDAVKKNSFSDSVKRAADFIRTCTNASSMLGIPAREGVCFENFLTLLQV